MARSSLSIGAAGTGSAMLGLGEHSGEGLGGGRLRCLGGSGGGCVSGDSRGGSVGGGGGSVSHSLSCLKSTGGSVADGSAGGGDSCPPEDSDGLVFMGEELVVAEEGDLCLGLHGNIGACCLLGWFDVFSIHKFLEVFEAQVDSLVYEHSFR